MGLHLPSRLTVHKHTDAIMWRLLILGTRHDYAMSLISQPADKPSQLWLRCIRGIGREVRASPLERTVHQLLQIQIEPCRRPAATKYFSNSIVATTLSQRAAMLRMIDREDGAVVIAVSRELRDVNT